MIWWGFLGQVNSELFSEVTSGHIGEEPGDSKATFIKAEDSETRVGLRQEHQETPGGSSVAPCKWYRREMTKAGC